MAIFECVIMYRDRHQVTFPIDAHSVKEAYQKALVTGKDVFTITNINAAEETYLRVHLKQLPEGIGVVQAQGMQRMKLFPEQEVEKPVPKKKK